MARHPCATQAAPFKLRRDVAALTPKDRLALPVREIEAFYRLPSPAEVTVVWPPQLGPRLDAPFAFVNEAPRHGDYLFLRKPGGDRKRAYWCVKMRAGDGFKGRRWSTKFGKEDLARAVEAYIAHFARLRDTHLNGAAPETRFVSAVLDDYLEIESGRHYDLKLINSNSLASRIEAVQLVAPYVDGLRVGDIDKGFSTTFMQRATAAEPYGGGYAHNTARGGIIIIKRALEWVLSTKRSSFIAEFDVPVEEATRVEVFTAPEMDRVPIAAATGKIWDAGDWARDPKTGGKTYLVRPRAVARAAEPYGRLFEIGWIFGSRVEVDLTFTWDDDGGPWFDLEGKICHRLGKFQEETAKRRGSCPIPPQHLPTLRAWRAADRKRGIKYFVHTWNGAPLKEICYPVWYSLLRAAGVSELHPHCLKHTCVTLMRIGKVPVEAAAAYLSTDPDTLIAKYGRWDYAVSAIAAEALGSLDVYRARYTEEQAMREIEADMCRTSAANDNGAVAA